jgi:polyphosphate kinase
VRIDVEENPHPSLIRLLKIQWDLDDLNILRIPKEGLIDFTGILQIIGHREFKVNA